MKLLYLPLLFVLWLLPADAVDSVAQLMGKGAITELAKYFPAEVEIALPGTEENTYSKAAAQSMLEKFFAQNKPLSSKVMHRIDNGSSFQYAVVILNTAKGPYRVSIHLKNEKGNNHLVKLIIETEKVK